MEEFKMNDLAYCESMDLVVKVLEGVDEAGEYRIEVDNEDFYVPSGDLRRATWSELMGSKYWDEDEDDYPEGDEPEDEDDEDDYPEDEDEDDEDEEDDYDARRDARAEEDQPRAGDQISLLLQDTINGKK